jgi:hypothetical protein
MYDISRKDLDDALARFLDGEPEPHDDRILAAAMKSDKAFADEVRSLLMVDDLLRQNESPDDCAFVESVRIGVVSDRDGGDFFTRFVHFRRGGERTGTGRRRLIAVAVVVLLPLAGAVMGRQWWTIAASRPGTTVISGGHTPDGQPKEMPTAAMLTRVVNAQWEPADGPRDEGSALSPGHIRLQSGLVQIEFISGASVIIEGPCDFELQSPRKAICHRGKLRAHVPPHARGFTIAAPGVNAVDLGTEFAMSVDEHGRGRLHVVEGEVELQGVGDHAAAADVTTLKAGSGADFGLEGVVREIAADPTDFVDRSRLLRLENDHHLRRHQLWLAHSRALRADPATVLYFSFEVNNTWERTLRNVAGTCDSSLDGSVVGCLWCPGRWLGKTALEFKRTSDRVRINVPGRFDQLSMATWVRIEGLNNCYSSLMLTDDFHPEAAHWQLTASGQIILGVRSANKRQPNVDYASPAILGPSSLGQWVHIATVFDNQHRRIFHYLNGNRVSEERLHYPVTLQIGSATIGNWSQTVMPSPHLCPIRSLNGRIDEFAILRRVLTSAEIKEMYELGKPSS